jgi:hypothetical protein
MVSFTADGLEAPSAMAWTGNLLVISDENGVVVVHDFEFQTQQRFTALPRIVKIEFSGSDLFFLTKEGILGHFRAKTPLGKWSGVMDFAVSRSGAVFTKLASNRIKRLLPQGGQMTRAIAPIGHRLVRVSAKILNMLTKTPRAILKQYQEAGLLFEATLWRVIDWFFTRKRLSLKLAVFGGGAEVENRLRYRLRCLSPSDSVEAVIALQARLHDVQAMSETLTKMSPADNRFLLGAIAGALLATGNVNERTTEMLKMAAVSLFANQKTEEGAVLLQLCGLDLTAVQYLQDTGHWQEALEILKLQEPNAMVLSLIRKCAHHWLDHGQEQSALLLFASLGDFHPLLAILVMLGNPCAAFHVMMYLDSQGPIREYTDEGSTAVVPIIPMELLRQQIIQQSEPFLVDRTNA